METIQFDTKNAGKTITIIADRCDRVERFLKSWEYSIVPYYQWSKFKNENHIKSRIID